MLLDGLRVSGPSDSAHTIPNNIPITMRTRILQALTWATVAAAVVSALWLAWAEAGNRNDGMTLSMAQAARSAEDGRRGVLRPGLRAPERPHPAPPSSSR